MNVGSRILVTGPTGFIGQRLCESLTGCGFGVRAAVRRSGDGAAVRLPGAQPDVAAVGDIHETTDWSWALAGITEVVHLAGRAHVMRERLGDPLVVYRRVNVAGTLRLAEAAVAAGVRRFVFVSSIKVNGEATLERPFRETDLPAPLDAYGISKHEAEEALKRIGREAGMEIVVVRPALVYGPGVKGNFLSLLRWMRRGLPLPLARCDNRRSFVGLTNLVDLLIQCVLHPAAANETFLAADGEDLSTPELLRRLARALGRKAWLLPFPPAMLRIAAGIAGRPGLYERLCGSLQVDASKARELLGWRPPSTVDEELARTANWFLASHP